MRLDLQETLEFPRQGLVFDVIAKSVQRHSEQFSKGLGSLSRRAPPTAQTSLLAT